jgi:hypothetical protein
VRLVGLLVAADLLLQLFLHLLALVVLSQPLIFVLFYFLLDDLYLVLKLFGLHGQFPHELRKGEIALLCFDKVTHKLINVLGACRLQDAVKSLLILFKFVLGNKDIADLVPRKAPEGFLALPLQVHLFLLLSLPVQTFKLILLSLLSLHELFHLLLLLYLLVDLLNLLVKIGLFFLSLPYKLNQLFCSLFTILGCRIGNLHNFVHLTLLGLKVPCQFRVDLLEHQSLSSQRVDFFTHLFVVSHCRVVLLVRFVKAVLKRLDLLDEFGMLLLWCYTVHGLLFLQNFILDPFDLLVHISLINIAMKNLTHLSCWRLIFSCNF